MADQLTIGLVLPDVLGTYGDDGNALVLRQRARMRGFEAEILPIRRRETLEHRGLVIRALPSTDEGVAFDIDYQGRRIYHAGDLNWWAWSGESATGRPWRRCWRRSAPCWRRRCWRSTVTRPEEIPGKWLRF